MQVNDLILSNFTQHQQRCSSSLGFAATTPHNHGPQLMEAVPQFGGSTTHASSASHSWGIKDVPTPSEIVAALDQHVIGQQHAKRVRTHECAAHGQLVYNF